VSCSLGTDAVNQIQAYIWWWVDNLGSQVVVLRWNVQFPWTAEEVEASVSKRTLERSGII
jgi:hypothetical protein